MGWSIDCSVGLEAKVHPLNKKTWLLSLADKSLTCKYATVSIKSPFSESWHFKTLISREPKNFFSPIVNLIADVLAVILSKALKCQLSEENDFTDTVAYLQVKDLSAHDNNQVFLFNGWTFASSPTLQSMDHPVYDLWITGCENI